MSGKSPYLTLAGIAGVFVTLLVVNMAAAPGGTEDGSAEYGAGTTEPGEGEEAENEAEENESEAEENESEPDESEPDEPTEGTGFPRKVVYAGHTVNDGPAIAIAVLGDSAAAYFCDGVNVEAWLKGSADDGDLNLSGRQSASIDARLKGTAVAGQVTFQDQTYRFEISPADPPAGLYRADLDDGDTTIGWIVLPDGSQVGIENAEGQTEPAPELTPGSSVEVDGESVEPRVVQGDADF